MLFRSMADKPWKKFERDIAKLFGTTRALMKGTDEVKDIGPEDDFPIILDCKLWKLVNWQIPAWFDKLQQAASKSVPPLWSVLCIREPGKRTRYAVVDRVRIMKFIAYETSPPITANDVYHWQAKGFGPKTLTNTWSAMMKSLADDRKKYIGRRSLSADVIPMVSMKNGTHNLTALRPKDLARLFRIGGILQDESSQH